MVTTTFPRSIAQDTVVHSIVYRASLCYGQLNRADDPTQRARLQGQLDAYVADLMDALRAASARLGEPITITPESVRAFIQAT